VILVSPRRDRRAPTGAPAPRWPQLVPALQRAVEGVRWKMCVRKRVSLDSFARSVRGCLALRGVAQEFEADRWLICVQVLEMFRGLVSLLPSSSAAILVFVYRPRGGDAELWEIARDLGAL